MSSSRLSELNILPYKRKAHIVMCVKVKYLYFRLEINYVFKQNNNTQDIIA